MTPRAKRPGDIRCGGIYGEKYRQRPEKRGEQCEQWVDPEVGFCSMHKEIPEERRCKGKGLPHLAMKNQQVCGIHGGKTPQALKAAERRGAEADLEAKITKVLARLDIAPVDNPLSALSQLAGQVVAWQQALAAKVNELTELRYQDAKGGEQLRSEVALYERAMDRCNTVLGNISRLNIDERMAVINERQADRVMEAIDALLEHLGIFGDQAVAAKRIVARKLRAA